MVWVLRSCRLLDIATPGQLSASLLIGFDLRLRLQFMKMTEHSAFSGLAKRNSVLVSEIILVQYPWASFWHLKVQEKMEDHRCSEGLCSFKVTKETNLFVFYHLGKGSRNEMMSHF